MFRWHGSVGRVEIGTAEQMCRQCSAVHESVAGNDRGRVWEIIGSIPLCTDSVGSRIDLRMPWLNREIPLHADPFVRFCFRHRRTTLTATFRYGQIRW